MKIVKHNTREAVEILRVLASSTLVEKKVCMNIANEINRLKPKNWKGIKLYPIEIPMTKLMERTTSNYEAIKRICKKMTSKTIQMKIPYTLKNGKTEIFESTEVIFPSCGISDNVFKIEVKETVMPLFCRALERYRHYNIIDAKFLTHKHSIEMYKFLKDFINRNPNKTDFEISINDLRYELGLEDKYKTYPNFKLRVLEPVKIDLKSNSIVYYDYLEIKTGRAVTHLRINIFHSQKTELNIMLSEQLAHYKKAVTGEEFRINFEIFLKEEYCLTNENKLYKSHYQDEMKKLKKCNSIADYSQPIQEQFISFVHRDLIPDELF